MPLWTNFLKFDSDQNTFSAYPYFCISTHKIHIEMFFYVQALQQHIQITGNIQISN